jgi:ribosomal protein S18 acetylase RimI-like enzyme
MKTREFVENDWGVICDIWNRAKQDEFNGTCDRQAIILLQDDPAMIDLFITSNIIIGEDNGKIVGFAGHKNSLITWLFVDPYYYRKGYGSLLLDKVVNMLKDDVLLNVGAGNKPALALYRKFGFEEVERFEGKHNGYTMQAVRMTLKKNLLKVDMRE